MGRSSTSFAPGNFAAVKSGSRSPRMVSMNRDAVAEEIRVLLAEHLDHLAPQDAPVLDQAVDVATRLRLLSDYLERQGGSLVTSRGGPRSCAQLYVSLHRLLLELWRSLGVGPASRAHLLGALGLAGTQRQHEVAAAQARLRAKVAADIAERDETVADEQPETSMAATR